MKTLAAPQSFERLQDRYRFTADLVAATGMRIGAGRSLDAAATDQPVIRDALGKPYIPGSSLKGSMRSKVESILRSLKQKNSSLWACELFELGKKDERGRRQGGKRCVGDSEQDQARAERNESIPIEEVLDRCCTACSLFGSPFLAGRIFIHDLPLASPSKPRTEIRDGVGIHRDLGVAAPNIKYDAEVVPAGTAFRMEMILENLDPERLALILLALDLLDNGEILLGGQTGRGLGKMQVKNQKLEKTSAERLLLLQGYEEHDYPEALAIARQTFLGLLTDESEPEGSNA